MLMKYLTLILDGSVSRVLMIQKLRRSLLKPFNCNTSSERPLLEVSENQTIKVMELKLWPFKNA